MYLIFYLCILIYIGLLDILSDKFEIMVIPDGLNEGSINTGYFYHNSVSKVLYTLLIMGRLISLTEWSIQSRPPSF